MAPDRSPPSGPHRRRPDRGGPGVAPARRARVGDTSGDRRRVVGDDPARVAPTFGERIGNRALREGEATSWTAEVSGVAELDVAVAAMPDLLRFQRRPEGGAVVVAADADGVAELTIGLRATRWGRHQTPAGPRPSSEQLGRVSLGSNDLTGADHGVPHPGRVRCGRHCATGERPRRTSPLVPPRRRQRVLRDPTAAGR